MFKPLFGTPLERDNPFAQGLVGCWLFNEGTGKYVWDATGNGNDGICTNMADPPTSTSGWGPGPNGGALVFNGTNNYVAIPTAPVLAFPVTYLAWAKTSATGVFATVLGSGEAVDAAEDFSLGFTSTNTASWLARHASINGIATSTGTYTDGNLHQLIGVSAAKNDHKLYVDNILVASSVVDIGAFPAVTKSAIGVLDRNTLGSFFTGLVDSASIYNRVLSDDDRAYLYAFPYAMFEEESLPAWMISAMIEEKIRFRPRSRNRLR